MRMLLLAYTLARSPRKPSQSAAAAAEHLLRLRARKLAGKLRLTFQRQGSTLIICSQARWPAQQAAALFHSASSLISSSFVVASPCLPLLSHGSSRPQVPCPVSLPPQPCEKQARPTETLSLSFARLQLRELSAEIAFTST